MMAKAGLPIEKIEEDGVMLPVVAVECHYKLPARMGDVLRIVSSVEKVPLAKLIVKSEIFNQHGDLLAFGTVTLGFIDSATRHPVRCPESLARVIAGKINEK